MNDCGEVEQLESWQQVGFSSTSCLILFAGFILWRKVNSVINAETPSAVCHMAFPLNQTQIP